MTTISQHARLTELLVEHLGWDWPAAPDVPASGREVCSDVATQLIAAGVQLAPSLTTAQVDPDDDAMGQAIDRLREAADTQHVATLKWQQAAAVLRKLFWLIQLHDHGAVPVRVLLPAAEPCTSAMTDPPIDSTSAAMINTLRGAAGSVPPAPRRDALLRDAAAHIETLARDKAAVVGERDEYGSRLVATATREEWEYGVDYTREVGRHVYDGWRGPFTDLNEARASAAALLDGKVMRRRPATPWVPVETEGGEPSRSIEDLIERSSLGTPEAKAARASVSDEHAARVVARAHELDREDGGGER
ncbi:hypothetical protein [Nocardioides alkalitolerans]|uniref:hypothetical protein n=1 Tax=Nocardioides alkalitolerans TaxID=281714 RepID=UPI0004001342|nr:hypothetical protein [Nocardioides alkalitolerans]